VSEGGETDERDPLVSDRAERGARATPAWAEPVGRLRSAVVGRSARVRAGGLAGRLGPGPSRPPALHSALFLFPFCLKIFDI
jgi:hypothetical protein